jgi:hypothetical protein
MNIYEVFKKHLESTPICEKCNKNKSIAITPFGKIEAACKECIDKIYFELSESKRISEEVDEEYGYD